MSEGSGQSSGGKAREPEDKFRFYILSRFKPQFLDQYEGQHQPAVRLALREKYMLVMNNNVKYCTVMGFGLTEWKANTLNYQYIYCLR